ncbi:hypothetical protein TSH58p_17700 [Azospirillum sp. TSH58]|uniref:hypothetical protein n=1 Tax=Azospirillum sp. TSH58 TaxID=664962 RepID=UPI000D5FF513|nr:hypothetical protein [Azospirillum sp. TSH58]AWJ85184.1 hypothetical protein TSH58p_17625 [Azospirillum sp. TSH58]AWJ85198.1 hypothetical protein TSH58p_17700 [Azospirillum sp. TSH58]PWC72058.1 hypothetical protein TSH58_09005 [Azospirillum sp. TSH58]
MSDPLVRVSGLSLLDGEPDERGRLPLACLDVLVGGVWLHRCTLVRAEGGELAVQPPAVFGKAFARRAERGTDHAAWAAVNAAALAAYRTAGGTEAAAPGAGPDE